MSWVSDCSNLAAALHTSDERARNVAQWWPALTAAATREGLSPELVAGVVWVESRFNPRATSPKGARGLMQVMPATHNAIAAALGVSGDPYDPAVNLAVGTSFLRRLIDRFPDRRDAITAYNAGPGNVSKHGADPWAHYYDAVISGIDRFTRAKKNCEAGADFPATAKNAATTQPRPTPQKKAENGISPAPRARRARAGAPSYPQSHAGGGAAAILLVAGLWAASKGGAGWL